MEEAPEVQPAPGAERTGCAIGALLGAAPFYLLTVTLVGFERRNPEDGMAIGFVMIAQIPLWLALSTFLVMITQATKLPKSLQIGLWAMLPLCAIASFSTVGQMGTDPNWMTITPVGLPIVAMLFGFWARSAAAAPADAVRKFALGFGAVAVALCAVPVIGFAIWVAGEPARQAQYEQEQRESAALVAAMDARCASLGPETPLEDYLDFLEGGSCHEKARETIARAPRRQGDAERLLGEGALEPMKILNTLPIEATPELCRNYGRAIDRRIGELRTADPIASELWSTSYDQITNLRWLMARGCDLSPRLRQLAALYRGRAGAPDEILAASFDELVRNGVGPAPETNATN